MSLYIDKDKVLEYKNAIHDSITGYTGSDLGAVDDESTISANDICKNVFSDSQNAIKTFKDSLAIDTGNISALAEAFEEYDKKMGENNKKLKEY